MDFPFELEVLRKYVNDMQTVLYDISPSIGMQFNVKCRITEDGTSQGHPLCSLSLEFTIADIPTVFDKPNKQKEFSSTWLKISNSACTDQTTLTLVALLPYSLS